MMCVNCKHAKVRGVSMLYCALYGIFIHVMHEGCVNYVERKAEISEQKM